MSCLKVNDWVKGVAASGTFYIAKDYRGFGYGPSGIPEGWTSIEKE